MSTVRTPDVTGIVYGDWGSGPTVMSPTLWERVGRIVRVGLRHLVGAKDALSD
jgi:hypothetical protein